MRREIASGSGAVHRDQPFAGCPARAPSTVAVGGITKGEFRTRLSGTTAGHLAHSIKGNWHLGLIPNDEKSVEKLMLTKTPRPLAVGHRATGVILSRSNKTKGRDWE